MAVQPSTPPDNLIGQLRAQLTICESRVAQLQQEKIEMEVDFEHKRSRIKELYYAKENALREHGAKLFESNRHISQLESTIIDLQEEIDNVKMIASVSENTKAEAVENLNKHHQEEIESLRCVLKDSMEEQRSDLVRQFEQERRHWEQEREKISHDRDEAMKMLEESQSIVKLKQDEPNDQELELSMKQAQTEAEALKSVVVPLETEISTLKDKLRIAEESLSKSKKKLERAISNKDNDWGCVERENQPGETLDEAIQVRELSYNLHVEKSSRSDLQFYVDVINKQKSVLQNENETLKVETHEVCRLLEQEINEHSLLKETWKAANEEFLQSQKLLMRDMEVVKSVLTEQQWKIVKNIQLRIENDQNDEGEKVVNGEVNESSSNNRIPIIELENFATFPPVENMTASSTVDSVSTVVTEYQDTISISSVSSMPGGLTTNETPTTQRVLSAPQLNLIGSEDQSHDRKIANRKDEPNAWDEVPASEMSSTESNHVKLKTFQDKLTKMTKLQQEEFVVLQDQVVELKKEIDRERRMRIDVEESVTHASEEAQKQIREITSKLSTLEGRMDEDKSWRKRKETEDDKRLTQLVKDRDRINEDFHSLKRENDFVKRSYEKHRIDLNKEQNLPTTIEGLQFQINQYRQALLACRVEKNHVESKLQSQLTFLQDRLQAELVAKEQIENTLMTELDEERKKLSSLHDVRSKLDKEVSDKQELQVQVEKDQISIESIRTKSKEIIRGLKEKLLHETTSKDELESKLAETKNKLRSMQSALETSEHVQQDFVRLSQSLQMKLEEIRQKEETKLSNSSGSIQDQSSPVFPTSSNHNPG